MYCCKKCGNLIDFSRYFVDHEDEIRNEIDRLVNQTEAINIETQPMETQLSLMIEDPLFTCCCPIEHEVVIAVKFFYDSESSGEDLVEIAVGAFEEIQLISAPTFQECSENIDAKMNTKVDFKQDERV
jgi:hypothetical protein